MMKTEAMQAAELNDADLVAESLSGNREAFARIVERYQTLIASLAYSATGNLGRSEDLAQETFVSAWKQLAELRDPAKLRPWLCSIARFLISKDLRRQGRDPAHAAESLEAVDEWVSLEPLPPDQVISEEEKAILWRSLERIPETYREPLVLFYRGHQSIEAVARGLGLSEDAVKQRLSRGRKLLQEQYLAFVAGALEQTSPGKAFTLGVMAALPLLAATAQAATVGTALAQPGSVAAKTTAGLLQTFSKLLLGFLYWLAPVLPLGGFIGYKMGGDRQHSERARRAVATFWRTVGASMLLLVFLPPLLLALWLKTLHPSHATFYTLARIWLDFLIPALIFGVVPLALGLWIWQRRRIDPETAGGREISGRSGKSTTIWVALGMTGALVCLVFFFWLSSMLSRNSNFALQTHYLSSSEVQNLIGHREGRGFYISLWQYRNGFRYLSGVVREPDAPESAMPVYAFNAPAEESTLALLAADKGISYRTQIEGRDFTRSPREVVWLLGQWAMHLLMPAFCAFVLVAGAATLLCGRGRQQPPAEPHSIPVISNERRVDNAFTALAACGLVAVAVLLALGTDWKVRRITADQLPGIIAQHKNARFEVFEYKHGPRQLWISDRRSPDFIAPADESTLGLLSRQGISYQTRLADIDWWYRPRGILAPSSVQPHPSGSGRRGLSQPTSALGILVLVATAGCLFWCAARSRPMSSPRI
jgi:RNA polymerase sigma factor (sigma-70 family)